MGNTINYYNENAKSLLMEQYLLILGLFKIHF